jgi:sugar phosphate isomerase/epimerase
MQRRSFLQYAMLLGGGAQVQGLNRTQSGPQTSSPSLHFFTKHLQWLDYTDLATVLVEAGFDGADLTVRPGGHVEPERATKDLPIAIRALLDRGLTVGLVTTRITSADEPGTEDLLRCLADNGVRHYRMGYISYDDRRPLMSQLDDIHRRLSELAELNARFGLCANYQNHAGTRFGASVWDIALGLRGLDTRYIGCQFDVRHAVYEGARSWKNDLRAIAPFVTTVVVKDFTWQQNEEGKWTHRNVPLGEGAVDFGSFNKQLMELDVAVPVSLHAEYPLLTAEEEQLPEARRMAIAVDRLRHDVTVFRNS